MNSNRKIIRTVSALAAGAVIAVSGSPVSAATLEDTSKAVDTAKTAAAKADTSSSALSGISLKLASILADTSDTEAKTEANDTDTVTATDDSQTQEADPYANIGIVATGAATLNVRSAADASASVVGKLYNNNACTVVENLGDWLHITSGNVDGYVASAYVTVGDAATCQAAQTHTAAVNCDGLYVRAQASTDSSVVELVTRGTVLTVTDLSTKDQGWVAVTDGHASGYVSTDYVTLSDTYSYGETSDEIAAREAAEAAAAQAKAQAEAEAQAKTKAASAAKSSAKSSTASDSSASTASSSASTAAVSAPISSSGSAVASYAAQFIGNPYKYGGTSLTNGADCSGFVMAVYAKFGVSLPHSSSADRSVGSAVSVSDMQAGDIVCYNGHVGIYAGGGKIVNATNPSGGIAYTNVNYKPIVAVRRVL